MERFDAFTKNARVLSEDEMRNVKAGERCTTIKLPALTEQRVLAPLRWKMTNSERL